MKKYLNLWFYIPFFAAALAAGVLLLLIERGQDVIFVNRFHTPFFDYLFYYGTTLGNGLLYLVIGVLLVLKNLRHAVIAITSFSVNGLLILLLKNTLFDDVMRPGVVLAGAPLHFVEGVTLLRLHSFPSGHTAMAFSLFCLLSLMLKEKKWGLVFLFMALIGGVSRIYLVQHFFVDVYFGALLGVVVTTLIWYWFMKTEVLKRWDSLKFKV